MRLARLSFVRVSFIRQSFVRQSFVRQSFVRQSFVSFARGEKRKRGGGRRGRSGLATVKIRTPHRDVGKNKYPN